MSLMPSPVFNGNVFAPASAPVSGYKAKFYAAGTAIAKTIYQDADLNTPYPSPSNVAVMNSLGYALIYLGPGTYKLVFTDPSDSVIYTQDDIQGDGSFGTGFVDSFAALADVNPLLNKYTYIGGFASPGDGGQGMFYNKVSGVASDGGYTLQSNVDPTYVWFRIPDESGDVRAASFGYIPTTGTVQTTQLQAADNYATSIGARLVIEAGADAQVGAITFNAPYVHFEPGARLKGVASPPQPAITFNGIVTGPNEQIFAYRGGSLSVSVTMSQYQVSEKPQWFGAIPGGGIAVNDAAFAAWKAAGGGFFILPPGDWPTTNGTSLQGFTKGVQFLGTSSPYRGLGAYLPGDSHFLFDTWNLSNGYSVSPYAGGAQIDGLWKILGDLSVDGDTHTTGNISSDGNIAATGNLSGTNASLTGKVEADGDVVAGKSLGGGSLKAQAGTGSAAFKSGGLIAGGAQNASISATDFTLTLPANTLTVDKDEAVYTASGTYKFSTSGTLTLKHSGTTIASFAVGTVATDQPFYMAVRIVRTAATTATCVASLNGDVVTHNSSSISGVSLTFSGAIALDLQSSDTGLCKYATIEAKPTF